MEDKIIGPLTLKQFIYLMAGGTIFYIFLKTGNQTLLVFIGIPAALLALFLAFVKIQDQPFSKFFVSFLLYLFTQKQRVWHKEAENEEMPQPKTQIKIETKKVAAKKSVEKSDLEKLANVLDTRGWAGLPKAGTNSNTQAPNNK